MSSFPQHESNMKELERLGLDVSDYKNESDADGVFYESWDYDSLTYIVQDCIEFIKQPKLSAAQDMRNDLELLRDHLAFLKGDDYELVVQADKTLAKADGKEQEND